MSNVVPIKQNQLSVVPQSNAMATAMSLAPVPKQRQKGGRPPKGTNPHVRRTLTQDELQLLFDILKKNEYGDRDYCMALMAYRHAFRVSELAELHWSQINTTAKEMYVYRSKNGQHNIHPLSDVEIAALNDLPDHRGYVFKSAQGGHLSVRAIQRIIQTAGRAAGFPFNLGTHIFRHTKITELAKRNLNAFMIQGYAGHKDIRSTLVYVHETADFGGCNDD